MNEERPEVDYGKARTSALKRLAATGDTKARDELRRRGETAPAADDLATKAYIELRDLVLVWRVTRQDVNAELTVTALEARRAMSFAAQAELERRYTEAEAAGRQPLPLPVPPWLRPRPPRVESWDWRAEGSKLYPSPTQEAKAKFNAMALEIYRK